MNTEPWYVYLLLCDQKTFYVGISNDVRERLRGHISKQSFFTKKFSEIKLVYCEKHTDRFEAARREKQLKGWTHTKKQMLVEQKLGYNSCTDLVEALTDRMKN